MIGFIEGSCVGSVIVYRVLLVCGVSCGGGTGGNKSGAWSGVFLLLLLFLYKKSGIKTKIKNNLVWLDGCLCLAWPDASVGNLIIIILWWWYWWYCGYAWRDGGLYALVIDGGGSYLRK